MADENKIKLGTIWLTEDGTAVGEGCRSTIQGLHYLKMKWWGNATRNARGNPEQNLTPVAGVNLIIQVPALPFTKLDDIITLFDNTLDSENDFELIIDGTAGNYGLRAEPDPDSSVIWIDVINGWARGVEIRVITKAL